ncbi:MAG: S8 family peptidase [Pseudomonadota bacterium]|nr:S8 family peptidase [Pseudomonadota bacterium]
MKTWYSKIALGVASLMAATAASAVVLPNASDVQASNSQIIVKFKGISETPNRVLSLDGLAGDALAKLGLSGKVERLMYNNAAVIKLSKATNGKVLQRIVNRLSANPSIEFAEIDQIMTPMAATPNDPLYPQLWAFNDADSGIDGLSAWDATRGQGATVAVLDTGYRPHVDFINNSINGYDFISSSSIGNDGNGRDSDARDPGDGRAFWRFVLQSSSWHGTHVAGTIGATANNGEGIVGVAPEADLLHVRVLGKGGGSTSDIADAIVWSAGGTVSGVPANTNPADVINMSLGGSGACGSSMANAIAQANSNGTIVVVAAGNSNANMDTSSYSPASCSGVITVAAHDANGNKASFSNYGSTIEISAPGVSILSTLNDGRVSPGNDNYVYYNGTSMATPHVAGVAALLKALDPSLDVNDVTGILSSSATPFGSGSSCNTSICGAGKLNAGSAVLLAQ